MPQLHELDLQIDWDQAVRDGQAIWLQKIKAIPVRPVVPGETAMSGRETAKEGHVAILDPENAEGQPLYFMTLKEFLATSQYVRISEEGFSEWYVECNPRRGYFVPEEEGPFHLKAPWDGHTGWDVKEVSEVQTLSGETKQGRLIIETQVGPMHDEKAIKAGLWKACPAPR